MSQIELIEKKIRELDTGSLNEVNRLIDTLLEKKHPEKKTHLSLSWSGGLKELRDQYTSVELQHKVLEGWAKHVSD